MRIRRTMLGSSLLVAMVGCAHRAPLQTLHAPAPVSDAVLDSYMAVAYGLEGGTPQNHLIGWADVALVQIEGAANQADVAEVDRVIADINAIAQRSVLRRVAQGGTVTLRIVGDEQYPRHVPRSAAHAAGHVHLRWRNSRIYEGEITLRSSLTEERRRHVLREELTQSLGLLNDTWRERESIFYQGPSSVTEFSPTDRLIVWLHVNSRDLIGDPPTRVRRVLRERLGIRSTPERAASSGADARR